jgi:hypothetical protein
LVQEQHSGKICVRLDSKVKATLGSATRCTTGQTGLKVVGRDECAVAPFAHMHWI